MTAATADLPLVKLRTLLRSIGQIVLQADAATGICVVAALALTNMRLACAALLGAAVANVIAVLTGRDRADLQRGLHGFNGALAALAAASFVADAPAAIAVALVAATTAALAQGPIMRRLEHWQLGCYSSPYLAATALWLPLVSIRHAPAPLPAAPPPFAWSAALGGILSSVAQTGFARGVLPGLLVLAGIAAASRRQALVALGGAAGASLALAVAGADNGALNTGLLGFNGALTALALCAEGLPTLSAGVLIAALLQALATHCGMISLTAPFTAATWLALIARRRWITGDPDVIRSPR